MSSFHIQTVESPLGYCLSLFSNFILLSSPSLTIQWAYQTFWFLHTDVLQPQACPCCSLALIVLSLTLHLPVIFSPSRLPLKYHFLRGPLWTTHLKYNSCYSVSSYPPPLLLLQGTDHHLYIYLVFFLSPSLDCKPMGLVTMSIFFFIFLATPARPMAHGRCLIHILWMNK